MYETLEQLKNIVHIPVWKISRSDATEGRGDPKLDAAMESLVNNIKNQGLIHAITVDVIKGTEESEDTKRYKVVVGDRRFEAVKIAGKETIKSVVLPSSMSASEKEMLTLSENILRRNYTLHERAKVVQKMLENWDNDKTALARALGYSSAAVIDTWLAPLNLDPAAVEVLKGPSALITKRAALLAKLPKPVQVLTAEIINEKNPNDHDLRKMVSAIKNNPDVPPRTVVENLDSLPRMTSMLVYLTQNVNEAFEEACKKLNLTKPKLAEKIIEEYLIREGYLTPETIGISKK